MPSVPDTCTLDGCGRPRRKRGLCNNHYSQVQRGTLKVEGITFPPCTSPDCHGTAYARGLCYNHWQRDRSTGKFATNNTRRCSVEDCARIHHSEGLCKKHYDQRKNAGRKDQQVARIQRWVQDNPDRARASRAAYRAKNKDKLRKHNKVYIANNPQVAERSRKNYRARKYAAFVESFTSEDVIALYGTNCHICLEPIDMDAPRHPGDPGWELGYHDEHVIPLAKGGLHSLDNVRPSHGLCNLRKGAR